MLTAVLYSFVLEPTFVLWNKLAKNGELRNIEEPLIKYRLVPFAITNNSNRQSMREIVKKVLQNGDITDEDLAVFKRLSTKQGKKSKISKVSFKFFLI